VPDDLLRVSVGCEHVEDLWADLQQALSRTADLGPDAGYEAG
jgi:cystathionine beta-lyase/cystathionine gamma-synthase